jgi:outer membrane protein assembly factor BamB/tRNA A-37 threonylcarbamoyl transferase component Bud32
LPFFLIEVCLETHRITQSLDPNDNGLHTQQLNAGTTLIDRYLIQDVIGVGGMGAVYRARDLHFPNVVKLVAVKEMVNQASDPVIRRSIIQNFEREANLLATLDHRSIPRIYDYFTHNERSYLILEFILGKDLEALINDTEGFVSQERIIAWAIELCEVIRFLHTHRPEPIIFRDMKPSNVMITPQDHVVLVDFGIAKTFQVGQKGTMIGTEGYSPPEQYRGEATPLADIYALGATMHHALTRRDPRLEPPFSFSERPIHNFNPNVSPKIEEIVYRALQYNPEDRYSSAEEMKAALVSCAQEIGLMQRDLHHAPAIGLRDTIKPLWSFQCEDEVRGSPAIKDNTVFIGSYDNNLYALSADKGQFMWKYATDGGIVSRPAVFENNVFFGSEDRRMHVISAATGRINWTYYTEGPIRSSPRVAEGHVFIGSDDMHLHAVNATTGRRAWSMEAGGMVRSTALVDHECVYFGTESGDFYCLDFTGKTKWRFNARRGITSSPVISQGVVYFGSMDSTLYALDAKSGWVIWRFRLGRPTISSPCLVENMLFIGASDGVIYCMDANASKEIWRYSTEHQVSSSPVVYRDSLYCGSVDGSVYCLEYRTGRLRWKFKTGGPVTGTPVAGNDVVYIGSVDSRIYALVA